MIELEKFCDNSIMVIKKPWSFGEFSYATNGHIIIRVPRRDDVPVNPKAPKNRGTPKRAINDFMADEPKTWYPIPKVHPEERTCLYCEGSGKYDKKTTCEECDGKGKYLYHEMVKVGDVGFSAVYLSWIAELPESEIGPMKPLEPARFRFNGGEGLLMPMRS